MNVHHVFSCCLYRVKYIPYTHTQGVVWAGLTYSKQLSQDAFGLGGIML